MVTTTGSTNVVANPTVQFGGWITIFCNGLRYMNSGIIFPGLKKEKIDKRIIKILAWSEKKGLERNDFDFMYQEEAVCFNVSIFFSQTI